MSSNIAINVAIKVNAKEGLCRQTRLKGFTVDISSYFNEGDGLVSVRVTSSPHKKQQDELALQACTYGQEIAVL